MTLTGAELAGQDAVVIGGTGNVGAFLVDAFVRADARVPVLSRSQDKIDRLLARLGPDKASHVGALIGDIGSAAGAVAAAPAGWHQTPSMLQAGFDDFKAVIENSLFPHYLAAQTFLPLPPAAPTPASTAPWGSSDRLSPGSGRWRWSRSRKTSSCRPSRWRPPAHPGSTTWS
ncbi:hypothetical protein ACFQVD_09790 [Streptosporangium amethystogenes subsp. fukuiense]|uniref:Uncharacterized protein n=1 Tax=Streptosporangium amethystogenes subsp. fukuiense TaxID=698418 RepID=A0ABW2SVT7_9ACTN